MRRADSSASTRCSTTNSAQIGLVCALMILAHAEALTSARSKSKDRVTVITGSKHIARVGTLVAPPDFLSGAYTMDWTAYIYILENIATHGSVQIDIDIFDLHPNSWLTVRKSKYSGYLGRVADRYNSTHPPSGLIMTDTCCLRLEFQTGCCGLAVAGQSGVRQFYGIRAHYKFVPTLFKGRRIDCDDDPRYPNLCNGECLPPHFDCPCSKFGQYKCDNEMCIPQDVVCDGMDDCGDNSDEEGCKVITPRRQIIRLLGMYALEPIVIGCGSMFLIGFCMACAFSLLDRHTRGICTAIIETTAKESGFLIQSISEKKNSPDDGNHGNEQLASSPTGRLSQLK